MSDSLIDWLIPARPCLGWLIDWLYVFVLHQNSQIESTIFLWTYGNSFCSTSSVDGVCDAATGALVYLMRTKEFLDLPEPLMQPLDESLLIQASIFGWKTQILERTPFFRSDRLLDPQVRKTSMNLSKFLLRRFRYTLPAIDWLVDCFSLHGSVDWLIDSIYRLNTVCSFHWLIDYSVDWLIDSIHRLNIVCSFHWLIDYLVDWLIE